MRTITRNFMATLEAYNSSKAEESPLITMESIAFQKNDKFGPELEAVIGKYKALLDAGANQKAMAAATDLKNEFESIILRRIGITVELTVDDHLAATYPNLFVPNNPMIRDDIRDIFMMFPEIANQEKTNKLKNHTVLGTVNTETAKVTGWFSQQKVPLFINFLLLFNEFGMNVPQVTAIVLHELGHDFEGIVYSSNINTTNQVLADIAKHISDKNRGGDVNYVFKKIKSVYPAMTMDIAEGLVSNDRVVLSVATYRLMVGISSSLMDNRTYDRTSYEAMADNFTARFGYGHELVQALEVLEDMYSEYDYMKNGEKATNIAIAVCGILSVVGTCMIIGGIITGVFAASLIGAAFLFIFGIIGTAVLNSERISTRNMTYDDIKTRYMRVRAQLVESIKDQKLDVVSKAAILAQIQAIDVIIDNKQVFESYLSKLSIKMIPSDRRAQVNIDMQKEIEKMIANDIFISANKLALKGTAAV